MANNRSSRNSKNIRSKKSVNSNTDAKLRKKIKSKKKKSAAKGFIIAFFVLAVITVVFLFLANKYVFKLEKIDISGHGKYSYDEILIASGVSAGTELYSLDLGKIKRGITDNLAYVDSVKTIRIPPSTLKINITTVEGVFGIKLSGDYYILSDKFKVLEKKSITDMSEDSPEKAIVDKMREDNIIIFTTASIKKCYVGEYAVFGDEDVGRFLTTVLTVASENQIIDSIYEIDITNKFDVKINYEDRLLIKFGSFEHADAKLIHFAFILNEQQIHETARGVFDLANVDIEGGKGVYTPDEKIFD